MDWNQIDGNKWGNPTDLAELGCHGCCLSLLALRTTPQTPAESEGRGTNVVRWMSHVEEGGRVLWGAVASGPFSLVDAGSQACQASTFAPIGL